MTTVRMTSRFRSPEKVVIFIAMLLLLLVAAVLWNYFRPYNFSRGAALTGGDPELGRKKLGQHSCVSCHMIPGISNGQGALAPPLASWSKQQMIVDMFPNTPSNLEQWIQNPSRLRPGTSMPDMNVSAEDSRDMAAYLYSLN
jgi:cytochrome c